MACRKLTIEGDSNLHTLNLVVLHLVMMNDLTISIVCIFASNVCFSTELSYELVGLENFLQVVPILSLVCHEQTTKACCFTNI